jgi:adenosylmethionine-8-amino-7-oxononanoate aminotransferase
VKNNTSAIPPSLQAFCDGVHGDHVLLTPPFITTEDQLDGAINMLDRAVQAVMADVI